MILVLIDTWWNVNHCNLPDMLSGMLVLIDTWWNVNKKLKKIKKKIKNEF